MNKKIIESLKNEYNNNKKVKKWTEYISFEVFLSQCKDVRQAILKNKLVIVAKNDKYSLYDIYYIKNNKLNRLMPSVKALQPYSVRNEAHYINVTCIGANRPYEIIYNLGRKLGIEHASDKQNII